MDDTRLYCTPFRRTQEKGNATESYCAVICLSQMWKFLTGVIAEEICNYLEQEKLFPEDRKGCRRGSRVNEVGRKVK